MPDLNSPAKLSVPVPPLAELAFIRDSSAARSLLDPLRRSILEQLREPGSATSVAQELDLPRQRVNYHVRELEREGLLRHIQDRRRGNCLERVVRAVARVFVVDPDLLGLIPAHPDTHPKGTDAPFSSTALLASAGRTIAAVGALHDASAPDGRRIPTLSLETQIRFRSARDEVEFAQVIERVLQRLVTRYDTPSPSSGAASGRTFRIALGGHPDLESEGGRT